METSFIEKFKGLSNDKKLMIYASAAIIPIIAWSIMSGSGKSSEIAKPNVALTESVTTNGLTPEGVAASNESLRNQLVNQQRELDELKSKQGMPNGENPISNLENSAMSNRVAQLEEQIRILGSTGASKGLSGNLPDPNSPINAKPDKPTQTANLEAPEVAQEQKLRIIKSSKPVEASGVGSANKPVAAYLPAGSNFEAVLINGMDAGTGVSAAQKPTPALLRIKTDAILPNLFKQDVRECFILVAAVGNMNSERAEMRTTNISCIAENGKAFEGNIEGYIVGEDGKVGARGRAVSKVGGLLGKSLLAGLLSGVGAAMAPSQMPSLSLNSASGGQAGYQYPNPDYVLGSGVGKGVQTAGQQLSQYYIKLAENMFPVIEIDAGRKVTVILLKGLEVK